MERQEQLRTARLTLRPIGEGDREAMYRIFFNEEVGETYMLPQLSGREEAEGLFSRFAAMSRRPDRFVYGMDLDGALIGFLNDCGVTGTAVELGYAVHPDFRGRGYAPEALRAVMEELFRLGFRQVTAGCFEENAASRRVMEKCGMEPLDKEETVEYRGRPRRCLYWGAVRQ